MPLIERLTSDVAADAPVALVLPGEKQDAGWRESAANQLEILQGVIVHIAVIR